MLSTTVDPDLETGDMMEEKGKSAVQPKAEVYIIGSPKRVEPTPHFQRSRKSLPLRTLQALVNLIICLTTRKSSLTPHLASIPWFTMPSMEFSLVKTALKCTRVTFRILSVMMTTNSKYSFQMKPAPTTIS